MSYDRSHSVVCPQRRTQKDQFVIQIKPVSINGPVSHNGTNWEGAKYLDANVSWCRWTDEGEEDDEQHVWTTEHITCGADGFPSNDDLLDYEKATAEEKAALEIPEFDLYQLPEFKADFDANDTTGHIYKVRVTLHPSSADATPDELHIASDQAITDAKQMATLRNSMKNLPLDLVYSQTALLLDQEMI